MNMRSCPQKVDFEPLQCDLVFKKSSMVNSVKAFEAYKNTPEANFLLSNY